MSSLSFTKLFRSILQSTLWVSQPHHVRVVWITMLAMADRHGVVAASIPGLASEAHVTLTECEEALQVFLSPDKYSRSKEDDGRRIFEIDGGWQLINYAKYRAAQSAEMEREQTRERMRDYRNRKRNGASPSVTVTHVTVGDGCASLSASASVSSSGSDPDPEGARSEPEPGLTEPPTYTRVPKGWRPSEAFYGEAIMAGVTRELLDEDVTYWSSRKLGGEFHDIEGFFRAHLPRLSRRREIEALGAKRATADPNDRLKRQADRIRMLEEQESKGVQ